MNIFFPYFDQGRRSLQLLWFEIVDIAWNQI